MISQSTVIPVALSACKKICTPHHSRGVPAVVEYVIDDQNFEDGTNVPSLHLPYMIKMLRSGEYSHREQVAVEEQDGSSAKKIIPNDWRWTNSRTKGVHWSYFFISEVHKRVFDVT